MQEYFAKRMAQLRKARGSAGLGSSVKAEATETSSPVEELGPVHCSNSNAVEPKKKKKKPVEELEYVDAKSSTPIVLEENENQKNALRKKKKRKTAEISVENENSSSTAVLAMNCEEPRLSKKKKLKHMEKEHEQTEEYKILQGKEDHIGVNESKSPFYLLLLPLVQKYI
ncbi:hypothetical protein XENOCAPTIV_022155 [Xenoophorus captivus]|uniref:Lysine-rich nucleolar protein 1 n=1 Tax=Xenoophorus captivus TaxID=1517983 RepID=A0ABV0SAK0_9TELE